MVERERASIPTPPRLSSTQGDSGTETRRDPLQGDEGIFEDILTELLNYDTTKPPSFLNIPGYDENENRSNGFSISTGWSNTFFPPGLEDQERSWNVVAAATESRIRPR
jgi:hypothetical protein